jgi:hypothetical protein
MCRNIRFDEESWKFFGFYSGLYIGATNQFTLTIVCSFQDQRTDPYWRPAMFFFHNKSVNNNFNLDFLD